MGTITQEEIDVFNNLKNIKVVFDVGARDNIDYLKLKPKAVYHLFEPNPEFFEILKEETAGMSNVYLNNYGLGDKIENLFYDKNLQSFGGSEALPNGGGDTMYPIKTLDWYIEENKIDRVDFIKIDTEGMDYKVLRGGPKAVKMARYIQYEYWNDKEIYKTVLLDFEMKDIGNRNIFCTRK